LAFFLAEIVDSAEVLHVNYDFGFAVLGFITFYQNRLFDFDGVYCSDCAVRVGFWAGFSLAFADL